MREKPILFSGPMVKAILEGRKTQTRRIVRDVVLPYHNGFILESTDKKQKLNDAMFSNSIDATTASIYQYARPPYLIGDQLWVRETWCTVPEHDNMRPSHMPVNSPVWYRAQTDDDISKWRPSIFMPRWASRITLEVTGVRVERLQDITEEDAKAEGVEPIGECDTQAMRKLLYKDYSGEKEHVILAGYSFQTLWNSINYARAPWESNPWVWVIEFEVVK